MRTQFITALVLFTAASTAFAASNRPSGYTTICKSNQTCTVPSTTNVAYGAAGKFVYKILSGSFVCNTATFGSDPNPSKSTKECSISQSGSSSSFSSSSSSTSSSTSSSSSSSSSGSTSGSASSECVAGNTISGKTVDCAGKKLALSCKGDSETQPPVLTLKNATVKNLVISASGASDGIHCAGNCTMENVVWEDICEDAATNLTDGSTMTIIGGRAFNSATSGYGGKPDKVFQHNSKNSTTVIKGGFKLTGEHGKLWRSCGNCTNNGGPRNVIIDNVIVDAKIGSIVGVNRNYGDKATIRNLKIKNYKSGSPAVCDEYKGVQKGQGESSKYGEFWNTSSCNVSKSDVSAL